MVVFFRTKRFNFTPHLVVMRHTYEVRMGSFLFTFDHLPLVSFQFAERVLNLQLTRLASLNEDGDSPEKVRRSVLVFHTFKVRKL